MKTLAFLRKTCLENLRDWKILSLSLVFTPFFVYLMYAYFHASPATQTLIETVQAVEGLGGLSEFDLYVPALLVLAIIMVLFTSAASLIKEVDKGTMSRLMLSKLSTVEFLGAVSISQVVIGLVTLLLAYAAALSVGYRPHGSLAAVLVVGAVSALAVVAVSVLVAAFLNTIFELLTVGCFPFFLLMFFSDAMMPLPKIRLFHLAGHVFNISDVLPTSLTTRAFNAILSNNAGLPDVWFEVTAIIVLTAGYFALGTWLFKRRHMRVS